MKLTEQQKEKHLKKDRQKSNLRFFIENRIKNNYPIQVEVINGFYVIESKLSTL